MFCIIPWPNQELVHVFTYLCLASTKRLVVEFVISVWQTYESVTESRSTRFYNEGQSKALV